MKLEYLFYTVGIIFIFSAVGYFAYEYVFEIPDIIKAIVLVVIIVVFFITGEILWEKNK